ncbi:MAG TPA: DciA family protein, partial [Bacteroidales bacterium]|nr:DciA family protein [Bacteroidales bacterium]
MNNDDAAPLKKVIEELLETYNLKSGFTQVRIQRIWSQIVGRHIAKRTSEIRLKNDTLFVRLNS